MIEYTAMKEHRDLPWPEDFYAEFRPKERREILDLHRKEYPEDPQNEILERLFKLRYKEEKRGKETITADLFMRAWMDMTITSGDKVPRFGKEAVIRSWKEHLNTFGIQGYPCGSKEEEELLRREWKAFFRAYIRISANDKRYSSKFLGLGRLDSTRIAQKLALEFQTNTETFPKLIGLGEEYHEFHLVAGDVFSHTRI